MPNTEQTPITTERPLNQDNAGEIDRPVVVPIDSNVIPFPLKKIIETPDFNHEEQGELTDQANPQGIDRDEINAQLDHDDYLSSVQSLHNETEATILGKKMQMVTHEAFAREVGVPRNFNSDVLAGAKSETAFQEVENLVRPAGTPNNTTLGSTALKIVVK